MFDSQWQQDAYWKLRPQPATPADDLCQCLQLTEIMLRHDCGNNPLHCLECNGEVAPERVGFDEQFADDINSWRSVFSALYALWLDSGEYEHQAKAWLLAPQGQVNLRGHELAMRLSRYVKTYYWWFRDLADDERPATACPLCESELLYVGARNYGQCEGCKILL